MILTGDVGKALLERMPDKAIFIRNYVDCYDYAINENRNLLFIYRSDYRKISQR